MKRIVAPRVGVWIETKVKMLDILEDLSHPVWVCGLKLILQTKKQFFSYVAPRVGVWIETILI